MNGYDFQFVVPEVDLRQPMQSVSFDEEPREDIVRSAQEGRICYKNVEIIKIRNPGSKDEAVRDVTDKDRQTYARQYEHWVKNRTQLVEGTPLTMVPFVDRARVAELAIINILTAEQLAEVPESSYHRLGHGARDLVNRTRAYLEAAKSTAAATKYAAENASLKSEVASLKKQIEEVNTRFEALLKEKENAASHA